MKGKLVRTEIINRQTLEKIRPLNLSDGVFLLAHSAVSTVSFFPLFFAVYSLLLSFVFLLPLSALSGSSVGCILVLHVFSLCIKCIPLLPVVVTMSVYFWTH